VTESTGAGEPREPPAGYADLLGCVKGRVLAADLSAVEGIEVCAVEFSFEQLFQSPQTLLEEELVTPDFVAGRTTTDAEGRFALQGLESRAVQLLAVDLGGPRADLRFLDHKPSGGETVDIGDIVLQPYVTFVGRVVDENSEPVAKARVRATSLPGVFGQFGVQDIRVDCAVMAKVEEPTKTTIFYEFPAGLFASIERLLVSFLRIPTTHTLEDGTFRLPGVPQGLVTLIADKREYFGTVKGGVPSGKSPERNVGDLYLTRGYSIEGIVLDGRQNPVPGLEIRAGIRPSGVPIPAAVLQPAGRTDDEGSFKVRGLPTGDEAYVAFHRSIGQPWSLHGPFRADGSQVRIELERQGEVLVRLLDASGAIVSGAELFISPDPLFPMPPILAPQMQRLARVERLEEGLLRVSEVDFGKYRLTARADGFALATTTIEVCDPPQTFDLKFEAAHSLAVQVVQAFDREPIEWAFVSVSKKGLLEQPIDRGRTDEDGRIVLQPLEAGEYQVSVMHPMKASRNLEVKLPDPTGDLLIELTEGGHLKGRVHVAGAPPSRRVFFAAFPDRGGTVHPTDAPTFTAATDEGDFFVPNLDPGTYQYMVRDRVVGKGSMALILTMRDDPLAQGEFVICEGETTELDVDLSGVGEGPAASLAGRIRINDRPAAELSVSFEGPVRRTAMTDENGEFLLDSLPAAEAQVEIKAPEEGNFFSIASSIYREKLELHPGEHRLLNLDLHVCSVYGSILADRTFFGTVAGTFAMLEGSEGGATLIANINPLSSSYQFRNVPDGDYTLRVRSRGWIPHEQKVRVAAALGDVQIDVELMAAVTVSGTFELPEGVELPQGEELNRSGPPRERAGPRRFGTFLTLVPADDSHPGARARVDKDSSAFSCGQAGPGIQHAVMIVDGKTFVSDDFDVPPEGVEGIHLVLHAQEPVLEQKKQ